jgi:hypothetical protein
MDNHVIRFDDWKVKKMIKDRDYSAVLNQDELGAKLNLPIDYAKNRATLEQHVPENLKDIVHYAIAWGIDDDGYRRDFILKSPDELKRNLKCVVRSREDELDDWLAGPEATGNTYTTAYIAFSNMRMASDEAID